MRVSSVPFFRKVPFIRIVPPFIAGILIQYYFPHSSYLPILIVGIAFLLLIIHAFTKAQQKFRFRKIAALLLYTCLCCLGSILTRERTITYHQDWIGKLNTKGKALLLKLTDHPIEKEKTWKITAEVLAFEENDQWKKASGRIWLYVNKQVKELQKDQIIVTRKSLQPISSIQNPGSFDYAAYCARQGIYHSIYLKKEDFYTLKSSVSSKDYLSKAQGYVRNTFQQYINGQQENAIASALVMGYKYDLDDDLLEAYSNTGVVHVIAVSGMHLGLIYGILLFFTKIFTKRKEGRLFKSVLILVCIWTFTVLTGAGPSVLRAAVIFSLMLLGDLLLRKNNTYNTLAASAFLLLLVNPFYLWDIGFQLSYLAVLSIVWIAGPLYRTVYFPLRLLRYVWQLIAITLSAQVLTTPIILYHFHQFPNLFLITNLLIVPLSGLVLYACIFLLLISPLHSIASFIGILVEKILWLMNQCILFFDRWSFAVTNHIEFHSIQVILYYLLVVAIGCRIMYKKKMWTIVAISCCMIILGFHVHRQIKIRQSRRLIIYQMPGQAITDIGSGGHYMSFTGSPIDAKAKKLLSATRTKLGLLRSTGRISNQEYPVIEFNRQKIVFANRIPDSTFFPADIVVIQKGSFLHMSDIHRVFKARQYIFDGNNALWKIRKWKKEADSLHLRHHSVPEQGAFMMEY